MLLPKRIKHAAFFAVGAIFALPIVWHLLNFYGQIWFSNDAASLFAGVFTYLYAAAACVFVAFTGFFPHDKA